MTGLTLSWAALLAAVPVAMAIHALMESAIRARRQRHSVRPGYPADRRRSWQ